MPKWARSVQRPVIRPVIAFKKAVAVSCFLGSFFLPTTVAQARDLTFEQRVRAQEAIERVYYSYQMGRTLPFEEAVPRALLEQRVRTYLKQSVVLERFWSTPVTEAMLRQEVERMVRHTRAPERLEALFAALSHDLFLIKECLARPLVVDRMAREFFARDAVLHAATRRRAEVLRERLTRKSLDPQAPYPGRIEVDLIRSATAVAPDGGQPPPSPRGRQIGSATGVEVTAVAFDGWARRFAPDPGAVLLSDEEDRFVISVLLESGRDRLRMAHYLVDKETWDSWWSRTEGSLDEEATGAVSATAGSVPEVAGGTGGCIDDTWVGPVAMLGAPTARYLHTAVWTGSHMIVWGGNDGVAPRNTGGRYDPATDSWAATAGLFSPVPRWVHTAVWTGSRMVVWGGLGGFGCVFCPLDSGAQYDPVGNTWTPTSRTNAPEPRGGHSAIWTGREMVVWGGGSTPSGGRYDPLTDSWVPTSLVNVPEGRPEHQAVWTGNEMVVWGGGWSGGTGQVFINTGGRYNPETDLWEPTSMVNVPAGRYTFASTWTGARMVIWGGEEPNPGPTGSGGRYDPATDTWEPTSTVDAPSPRWVNDAVWAGFHVLIWGGYDGSNRNDGGRYDPIGDTWTPISTAGAPAGRVWHRAVWTGSRMIVWGGLDREETYKPFGDGGVYCACAAPTALYRDADGDGYGDPGDAVRACGDLAGYSVLGSDCNDSDPAVWGIPGEVPDLQFISQSTLVWPPPSEQGSVEVRYDLLRSEVPSDFLGAATCPLSDTTATQFGLTFDPGVGRAAYWLVRAVNGCPGGDGPLGTSSDGTPRSGRSCP